MNKTKVMIGGERQKVTKKAVRWYWLTPVVCVCVAWMCSSVKKT